LHQRQAEIGPGEEAASGDDGATVNAEVQWLLPGGLC
jgi:hypothetical protein